MQIRIFTQRRDRAKYGKKAPETKDLDRIEVRHIFVHQIQIEDKCLYLIQLWADTFMMHQEEYKAIHEAYRVLRKEGVKFPERDPNMKYMINFKGSISPVFLAMEGNYIVPSNNQGGAPLDPKKNKDIPRVTSPEYKHEVEPQDYQNTLYDENVDDVEDDLDEIEISPDEVFIFLQYNIQVQILEESMNIANEIRTNATKPGDMKCK